MVDKIDEEIESAKEYAEMALDKKASGDSEWYSRFKEMANHELLHSDYMHQYATEYIEMLKRVYKPTTEMQTAWDESHNRYVERVAWIKQMLSM